MTPEKAPPRAFPFSRERRSCITCGGVTFWIRSDGQPKCPRCKRSTKTVEPIRRDRNGDERGRPR